MPVIGSSTRSSASRPLAVSTAVIVSAALLSVGPATTADAASVRTASYAGYGVAIHRASGDLGKLRATSQPFRRFVAKRLNALWNWTDNDPVCATSPTVEVKRWRSDGFARISNEGVFGTMQCARGGNSAIYVRTNGAWKAPLSLATQEGYYRCGVLRRFRVPVTIGGRQCYAADDQLEAYPGQ